MLDALKPVAPDPILGLMAAYRADPRPEKIDLGVGVYKDEAGETPVLEAVKQAERIRIEREETKAYIGPAGDEGYNEHLGRLMLGDDLVGLDVRRATVVRHADHTSSKLAGDTWKIERGQSERAS